MIHSFWSEQYKKGVIGDDMEEPCHKGTFSPEGGLWELSNTEGEPTLLSLDDCHYGLHSRRCWACGFHLLLSLQGLASCQALSRSSVSECSVLQLHLKLQFHPPHRHPHGAVLLEVGWRWMRPSCSWEVPHGCLLLCRGGSLGHRVWGMPQTWHQGVRHPVPQGSWLC